MQRRHFSLAAASVGLLELRAYSSAIGTGDPGNPGGWNPPANLVTPLNQVWQHQEQTYGNLYGFRNYGWDQVFANGGYINYCVRWDSSAPVSAALRDRIQERLRLPTTLDNDANCATFGEWCRTGNQYSGSASTASVAARRRS